MIDRPVAVAFWGCLFCATLAQSGAADPSAEAYFVTNVKVDVPVILLSSTAWAVSSAEDSVRKPNTCDPYCDPSTVNAWDRLVIDNRSRGAKIASNAMVALLPAQSLWLVAADFMLLGSEDGTADILILAETLTLSCALNQVVKTLVARPRPYMYRESDDDGLRKDNADDYRSFYSMHTVAVFSVLATTAYIYSKRYPHSRLKGPIWGAAAAAGASIAALRVAAGKHFYSDILAAAAIGSVAGILVPAFHLRSRRRNTAVSFYLSGIGAAGSF